MSEFKLFHITRDCCCLVRWLPNGRFVRLRYLPDLALNRQ